MQPMARRRVVTGLNADGVSVIVRDGPTPGRLESGWEELWAFDGIPASLTDPTDPADLATFRLCPAPGRMVSRIFTIRSRAARQVASELPAGSDPVFDYMDTQQLDRRDPYDPWMHRTPTIDIVVVISGEMDLVLDGGEAVHLQAGDSVIQRGTMHAWRNQGAEPCVAVAFIVRAE
jgi:mannose-6-phosphate isomerase-like protein (cupin superfamily)